MGAALSGFWQHYFLLSELKSAPVGVVDSLAVSSYINTLCIKELLGANFFAKFYSFFTTRILCLVTSYFLTSRIKFLVVFFFSYFTRLQSFLHVFIRRIVTASASYASSLNSGSSVLLRNFILTDFSFFSVANYRKFLSQFFSSYFLRLTGSSRLTHLFGKLYGANFTLESSQVNFLISKASWEIEINYSPTVQHALGATKLISHASGFVPFSLAGLFSSLARGAHAQYLLGSRLAQVWSKATQVQANTRLAL